MTKNLTDAAPDMLEALELMVATFCKNGPKFSPGSVKYTAWAKAHNAIIKAKN